jgi:hypothetical protein
MCKTVKITPVAVAGGWYEKKLFAALNMSDQTQFMNK